MMKQKKPDIAPKSGAVELTEERLDRVAGGNRNYEPPLFRKRIDKSSP